MIGPNLSAWAVNRRPLIIFFMLAALVAGVSSFINLGRAEDPVFTIRTMLVRAIWPGATLPETLDQVTERIERKLQEVSQVDVVRSTTRAGATTIFIDLQGSVTSAEVPAFWQEVRNKIGDIRHTLPSGVLGPFFNDDFGDTFGFIYGFTSDGFTHRELRDYVEDIRSKLLTVPDVSKIEILGAQDEEVTIEFRHDRVAALGIDYPALFSAVSAQNVVRPSGVIRTGSENVRLQVSGPFASEADILDVSINVGDRVVRLGDIADVVRGYSDPPSPLFRVNGKPAIGLAIAMRDAGDILALGKNIKTMMSAITADLPAGIEPALVSDQGVTVDDAISEFMASLWQAIAIILGISIIMLGLRPGAVVAVSIPLTLAIVMIIMQAVNIDLHRISLGALIIALCLLVDDAMTTVDAMLRRIDDGDDAEAAASYAYSNLAAPMLIGTLVTIAGFVPIGFAQSSAGEYTFSIFAVVGIALLVSWLVAVLFAPVVGAALLKPTATANKDAGPGFILRSYRNILDFALMWRWLTIFGVIALFGLAIWGLRFVPQQFFPASDRTELLVDLTLPQNASLRASEDVAVKLDEVLGKDPDVSRWSSYVGRGAIRFYLPLNVQLPNDFFAQQVIVAKDVAGRERLQTKLERLLSEEFPHLVTRVYPLELGPPVGWPVQYRIVGPDIDQIRNLSVGLADIVASHPETRRVSFDWNEPSRGVRIRIDQDGARRVGYSSEALAGVLNTVISGTRVTELRDGIYLIDVVARARQEDRVSLDNLQTLQVPLRNGRTVPLSQFATFEPVQEQPLVWRRGRLPALTVQADVAPGGLAEGIVTALAPQIAEYNAGLPAGYRVELGGIAEESTKSRASVAAVVPFMIVLMLTLLMLQLQSFQSLSMVVLVMPLGLIGVVAALFFVQKPLGFVAVLGVLALLGMIAKNAVILLTQIEDERRRGAGLKDAVVNAALSRFRPLMLTALSTVLGLAPIAPTVFWGPMAFAVMGGLLVATVLTLVFLPVLYVTWFSLRGGGTAVKEKAEALS
ncbi:MAG: ACR family transporter [Hyphomicrobium sp. 32-62-53]|nr:MAG: ACR family transporter [Hyphomicrobium sp. 12-62-95]OYX97613.1 MAG: ACR family transporter [Hyphomicrobium sp. 32-62-53]